MSREELAERGRQIRHLEKFMASALNMDLSRDEVIEVVIQTGPYSGFPKALNALALAENVLV